MGCSASLVASGQVVPPPPPSPDLETSHRQIPTGPGQPGSATVTHGTPGSTLGVGVAGMGGEDRRGSKSSSSSKSGNRRSVGAESSIPSASATPNSREFGAALGLVPVSTASFFRDDLAAAGIESHEDPGHGTHQAQGHGLPKASPGQGSPGPRSPGPALPSFPQIFHDGDSETGTGTGQVDLPPSASATRTHSKATHYPSEPLRMEGKSVSSNLNLGAAAGGNGPLYGTSTTSSRFMSRASQSGAIFSGSTISGSAVARLLKMGVDSLSSDQLSLKSLATDPRRSTSKSLSAYSSSGSGDRGEVDSTKGTLIPHHPAEGSTPLSQAGKPSPQTLSKSPPVVSPQVRELPNPNPTPTHRFALASHSLLAPRSAKDLREISHRLKGGFSDEEGVYYLSIKERHGALKAPIRTAITPETCNLSPGDGLLWSHPSLSDSLPLPLVKFEEAQPFWYFPGHPLRNSTVEFLSIVGRLLPMFREEIRGAASDPDRFERLIEIAQGMSGAAMQASCGSVRIRVLLMQLLALLTDFAVFMTDPLAYMELTLQFYREQDVGQILLFHEEDIDPTILAEYVPADYAPGPLAALIPLTHKELHCVLFHKIRSELGYCLDIIEQLCLSAPR